MENILTPREEALNAIGAELTSRLAELGAKDEITTADIIGFTRYLRCAGDGLAQLNVTPKKGTK